MIVVDSSIWIDHIRAADPILSHELASKRVLGHPLIAAEIALGTIRSRDAVLAGLDELPVAAAATTGDVRSLIEREGLHGSGLGFVDVAIMVSCRLTPDCRLWTRDRRLARVARRLGIALFEPIH